MKIENLLVVGAGIGGLTAAIALRRKGFPVEMIEKDPDWTVYGVGIIQQFNVIRAMHSLDLLDAYLEEAFGFDRTTIFIPTGQKVAEFDAPRLAGGEYPSNAGIRRPALQRVLADRAKELGVNVRLGVTAEEISESADSVKVTFSDGTEGHYDIVIGADGVFSRTRNQVMPDAPEPRYTGQWVWRYNFRQPDEMEGIWLFPEPVSSGLVPLGNGLMYMFLLSQEAPEFKLETAGAAAAMRHRTAGTAPQIRELAEQIKDDAGVVARPLEVVLLEEDWHRGRVVLLGDAVHASTPHLAQGAGMAIEDGIVLAEELERHPDHESAFTAYRNRRYERASYIARKSVAVGEGQMGRAEPTDVNALMREMMGLMAQPI